MVRSKLGLKVLGLCALVLGLMAIAASGAQAEAGAEWMVNGKNAKEWAAGLLPEVKVVEVENKTATLLFNLNGNPLEPVAILCTEATAEATHLVAPAGILGKVDFKGCILFYKGVLQKACEPHTGTDVTKKGLIVTKTSKGLIVLDEGQGTVTFEPNEGTTFVVIETGEECAIGEEVPVAGKLNVRDCKGLFKTEEVNHLIEELPKLTTLTALGQPAKIDGSVVVALAGTHNTLKWSGLPA